MSSLATLLPAIPGPSKMVGSPSKRGSERIAFIPSGPKTSALVGTTGSGLSWRIGNRTCPYKPGKKLSESLEILGRFKQNGHIDPDLFDVFVREKVYLQYAREFLDPEQIDEVDESRIPGYEP